MVVWVHHNKTAAAVDGEHGEHVTLFECPKTDALKFQTFLLELCRDLKTPSFFANPFPNKWTRI